MITGTVVHFPIVQWICAENFAVHTFVHKVLYTRGGQRILVTLLLESKYRHSWSNITPIQVKGELKLS